MVVKNDLEVRDNIHISGSMLEMAASSCNNGAVANGDSGFLCFDGAEHEFQVQDSDGIFVSLTPSRAEDSELLDGLDSSDFATRDQVAGHVGDEDIHHSRYSDVEAVGAFLEAGGRGSSFDADLLDGLDSTTFATVAVLQDHRADESKHHIPYSDEEALRAMGPVADGNPLRHNRYRDDEAWDSVLSRHGEGSGLDADFLDGFDSKDLVTFKDVDGHISDSSVHSAGYTNDLARAAMGALSPENSLNHERYTDGEAWSAVLSRHGGDSGLDADFLDGLDSSNFASVVGLEDHALAGC